MRTPFTIIVLASCEQTSWLHDYIGALRCSGSVAFFALSQKCSNSRHRSGGKFVSPSERKLISSLEKYCRKDPSMVWHPRNLLSITQDADPNNIHCSIATLTCTFLSNAVQSSTKMYPYATSRAAEQLEQSGPPTCCRETKNGV